MKHGMFVDKFGSCYSYQITDNYPDARNIEIQAFNYIYLVEAAYAALLDRLSEFCGIGGGNIAGTMAPDVKSTSKKKRKRTKMNKKLARVENGSI